MRMRTVEITIGAFIFAAMLGLAVLAFAVSGYVLRQDDDTYTVEARFNDVSGLTTRARVTMAGVTIGRVSSIQVDAARSQAVVKLRLNAAAGPISSDAGAKIVTEGVLGGKYIALVQGAEESTLRDGGKIEDTQGAIILEDLIGSFIKNLGK